ncbi:AAA domain protein [Corynebacterium ulcerans]|nr:AAA domain protein [Corynebacterium ulcerans]
MTLLSLHGCCGTRAQGQNASTTWRSRRSIREKLRFDVANKASRRPSQGFLRYCSCCCAIRQRMPASNKPSMSPSSTFCGSLTS